MSSYVRDIYCYCDQWCERCPQTARCAVFAGSRALAGADPESPGFWSDLLARFAESHNHIPGVEEWEIEVRKPTEAELGEAQRRNELQEQQLAADPLLQRAVGWQDALMALLEDTAFWRAKARAAANLAAVGVRNPEEALREAGRVTEHLHGLRRWSEVIAERLRSAVSCSLEGGPASLAPDGLARAALLSVAGSRGNLAALYAIFPDEDRILPLFTLLGTLERELEARFPGARYFVRPGLDEPAALREAS